MALQIELDNDLVQGIKRLAERHYGDREAVSISRVVEDALLVRLMLLEKLGSAGQEVDEPIINWEQKEPVGEQTETHVPEWLFRRRPS